MEVSIDQTLRPLSLIFLIQPHNSKSYMRALKICSSLWGGVTFPIIPFYKQFPPKFKQLRLRYNAPDLYYLNIIDNFDPDLIILDDVYATSDINFFHDQKVRKISEIENVINNHVRDDSAGIEIDLILLYLKSNKFVYKRNDSLTIQLPKLSATDLFLSTLLGNPTKEIMERIILNSEQYEHFLIFPDRIDDVPNIYSKPNVLSCIEITNTEIKNEYLGPVAFFLMNPTNLEDLNDFWNVRALGWRLLALPIANYRSPQWGEKITQHLSLYLKELKNSFHSLHFLNGRCDDQDCQDAYQYIRESDFARQNNISLSYMSHIPQFWSKRDYLRYDHAFFIKPKSRQTSFTIKWDGKSNIPLSPLKPLFDVESDIGRDTRFINQIEYNFDGMLSEYAQVLPEIPSPDLTRIVRWGYENWRFSKNNCYALIKGWTPELHLKIPASEKIISEWFSHRGFDARLSAPGKLAQRLLSKIGHMYGVNLFADDGVLTTLTLFEKRAVVLKKEIFDHIGKQLRTKKSLFPRSARDIIKSFLDKGIIQAGLRIQCTLCTQYSFYTLNEATTQVRCPVCQSNFEIPLHNPDEIKWAYQGLGIFTRNNKSDGIISVLLTLRFFNINLGHRPKMTSMLSFEVSRGGKILYEIDLAVLFKRDKHTPTEHFFCECKTEIDFKKKDFDTMKEIGKEFPGSILVFATLKSVLSENEKTELIKLVKFFRRKNGKRPQNPVLILTKKELVEEILGIGHLEDMMVDHSIHRDDILLLCEATCEYHLGLPPASKRSIINKAPLTSGSEQS